MTEEEKKAIRRFNWINHLMKKFGIEVALISSDSKHIETLLNLIEKLQKENENLKIDLEKANASIVDQTDKDNEIEHLENLLRGNLYDGYLYYKDIAREYQKNYALIEELKNKVAKRNNELIELEETSEKEFITKQEVKENYIPKEKIKEKIKEYNKEIKTYEDKMLEITQIEKHNAIENKDFIKYSCIISNFTDKIKLLKNLIEEE